jgi:hypothetical protein
MSEDYVVLGPIGLLAALMGAERGLDVHVFGRNNGGPREALVRELGGTFHSGDMDGPPRWIETRYPHGMHGRDQRHSMTFRFTTPGVTTISNARLCFVWTPFGRRFTGIATRSLLLQNGHFDAVISTWCVARIARFFQVRFRSAPLLCRLRSLLVLTNTRLRW